MERNTRKNEPLVYIILLNYNGSKDTIECVRSIEQINYTNYKIVIIDNCSTKYQKDMLIPLMTSNCTIINNNINSGYAGGNNKGIEFALNNGAEYICVLNNDTIVDKYFLDNMISDFYKNKNIGVVCPKIFEYDNREKVSYGGAEINYIKGGVYIYGINNENEKMVNSARNISFATGCCMLVKRDVFNTIGLLPEEYFLYFEDADFSIKVNRLFEIHYDPQAIIYHKESASTQKNSDNYQYYFIRNRLHFIKENFKLIHKITAYPITILYIVKKYVQGLFSKENIVDAIRDYQNNTFGIRGGRNET